MRNDTYTRERRARGIVLLRKMDEILDAPEHWIQGTLGRTRSGDFAHRLEHVHGVCLIGAGAVAYAALVDPRLVNISSARNRWVATAAARAVREAIKRRSGRGSIIAYNDEQGRTFPEIKAVLAEARAILERGEL